MIKIIDKDFEKFDSFKEYCKNDSFGTRIYSHFLCYGYDLSFVDFWVQIVEERVTCAICRLDSDFVVSAYKYTDFEELSAFLNFQDKLSVTFDSKYENYINVTDRRVTRGDVLRYCGNSEMPRDSRIITPENKEYYELLLTCRSDDFFVPDYQHFLSDVTRRQLRDMCYVYGIKNNDTLVSAAMTVSFTDFSIILGAVATHPLYRGKGYAGCIVTCLSSEFSKNKSVYIYTTVERNTRFYEKLGFKTCGRWTKLLMGDCVE